MEEYSDCCGAGRHHIFNELFADCLEYFVECEDFNDDDSGDDDDYPCDILNDF